MITYQVCWQFEVVRFGNVGITRAAARRVRHVDTLPRGEQSLKARHASRQTRADLGGVAQDYLGTPERQTFDCIQIDGRTAERYGSGSGSLRRQEPRHGFRSRTDRESAEGESV